MSSLWNLWDFVLYKNYLHFKLSQKIIQIDTDMEVQGTIMTQMKQEINNLQLIAFSKKYQKYNWIHLA